MERYVLTYHESLFSETYDDLLKNNVTVLIDFIAFRNQKNKKSARKELQRRYCLYVKQVYCHF